MIVCKYTKTDNAVFIPHLDLLRSFTMALRRQRLQINFSEGFNPHARIFFNQPLSLGASSVCEYLCADSSEDPKEFEKKLNASLPGGIKILKSAFSDTNPNVAAMMFAADYTVSFSRPVLKNNDFSRLLDKDELIISYQSKGKRVEKDVRALVLSLKNDDCSVKMRLRCGNVNLRADRLTDHILKLCGQQETPYVVEKTAVYDQNGNNLDKIFFGE